MHFHLFEIQVLANWFSTYGGLGLFCKTHWQALLGCNVNTEYGRTVKLETIPVLSETTD